jgi:tetratricopeptide (TPR) repeat protein
MMFKRLAITVCLVIVATIGLRGQTSQLGKVEFPTSGSPKAQEHFLRGLAALHSFWYEEALEAFRESTRVDPDFMMGYWGEAMAHNHPLWSEQDSPAARAVIAKIKDTAKLTARERAYLNAVKLLYGEGDKSVRDRSYSNAMEKIYREYPDDLDAAAFYSLSLLGLVDYSAKDYRLRARAGAIALDVYQKNPNHPGAAHYIIHSFDDPEHAILALPAARRYASIAPEAHHARHMPSHIFLQLGMWSDAAASNESAWAASEAWMKRKNLSPSVRDYHSLHWLLYVYLQQGRYKKAEELLGIMKKTMAETTYENKLRPGYYESNYANMAAAFVIETERWDLATKLFLETPDGGPTASAQPAAGAHGAHGSAQPVSNDVTVRVSRGQRLPVWVRGMAASHNGTSKPAVEANTGSSNGTGVGMLQVMALQMSTDKQFDKAAELMQKAVELEEQMGPPSGPPGNIKPSHELYGEILLAAGKPAEATKQFQISLLRQPNRARSLLGLARAAARNGDKQTAIENYSRLLEQWNQADPDLPELHEAKNYLKEQRP